jgi:hypothetical protein
VAHRISRRVLERVRNGKKLLHFAAIYFFDGWDTRGVSAPEKIRLNAFGQRATKIVHKPENAGITGKFPAE